MFLRSDKRRVRRTLERRWLRKFLSQSIVVRWCIILGSLAGLIGISVVGGRVEPLDLTVKQISPRTFVARVDFSYRDHNATEEEATRKASLAPNVYRLSMEAYQRDLQRIKHLLERLDRTAKIQKTGKDSLPALREIAEIWNEAADVPLTTEEVQSLITLPDKKVFLDALHQGGSKLEALGIVGDDQFSSSETTVAVAANPDNLSELKVTRVGQISTASQARKQLIHELSVSLSLPKTSAKAVEKIVADFLAPNLFLDLPLSKKFQAKQREMVAPIVRNFTKGVTLVERGELITADKLALLKEHEKEAQREFSEESQVRQKLGIALIVALIVTAAILILLNPTPEHLTNNREYALLATIVLMHLGFSRLAIYAADQFTSLSPSMISSILPVCFGPMLVAILIHRRHAYVAAFLCSFLLGVITQFHFQVMLTSLISAVVGVHSLGSVRRRTKLYEAGLLAGSVAGLVTIVFGIMLDVPWAVMGQQAGLAIGSALVATFLMSALLPLFESIFKVATELRWLELSDLNHPLLRRMVMEAPGTYHHSLVVANLAEHACEAIGAHALQARVCSYFHDIGKLNKPEYFCENQIEGENPHDDIAPNMSALIIIAHVKDGVDLAIQNHLARPIIDTIQQHHGTSHVTYFYRIAKRNEEDAKLGSKIMRMNVSDVPRVNEETYRYPGPIPNTKESGIISLADSVEGASRCMLKPTPQKIEALVSEIIEDRLQDGQLDDCPLSVHELRIVIDSFSKTLLSMMHARVTYPKDESKSEQPPSLPSAAAQ
jgi:cyclic-di-AMP phosphodiesterase PgpH